MQATEVKPDVAQRAPAAELPPTPAAERAPAAATEEASCCAVQSRQASARPWLIGGAVLAVPLLLYGGWDWLVGAGLSTVLIAVAPCLVMCALGLCMKGGMSNGAAEARKTHEAGSGEPPSRG